MPRIVCVVPTVRPERMAAFRDAWQPLFDRHGVQLFTVWDGDRPEVERPGGQRVRADLVVPPTVQRAFANRTDSVRNYGFAWAAVTVPDLTHVLTLDDDVTPVPGDDPIQAHLDVMGKPVPLSWMNTAHGHEPYLRGVPYAVRNEATVELSHGVWREVPDFDAPTQLQLTGRVPSRLDFFRGPVPRGVLFPLCGMNVMVSRRALPHLYYAPMGPTAGGLNRFGDIWMGVTLKRAFDARDWAVYTGAAEVVHTRASDVFTNLAQEAEGLRLNERWWAESDAIHPYFADYAARRGVYERWLADQLGVPL